MESSELDRLVREQSAVLWEHESYRFAPTTFAELKERVNREIEGKADVNGGAFSHVQIPHESRTSLSHAESTDDILQARSFIQRAIEVLRNSGRSASSKEVQALRKLQPEFRPGAWAYANGEDLGQNRQRDSFNGAIAMCLAIHPEFLDMGMKVRTAEADALARQLGGMSNEQRAAFDVMQRSFNDWMDKSKAAAHQLLSEENNHFGSNLTDWQAKYEALATGWEEKFRELEAKYTRELSFVGPVVHWKVMERSLRKIKYFWAAVVVILLVVGVAGGTAVLYHPPAFMLQSITDPGSIRLSLLWFVVVSLSVFGLVLAVRFASSATHLARDAAERRQLTMVYLALEKQVSITDEERKIVFGALFSRAKTGLLRGDASPSMTGLAGVVENLLKKS